MVVVRAAESVPEVNAWNAAQNEVRMTVKCTLIKPRLEGVKQLNADMARLAVSRKSAPATLSCCRHVHPTLSQAGRRGFEVAGFEVAGVRGETAARVAEALKISPDSGA